MFVLAVLLRFQKYKTKKNKGAYLTYNWQSNMNVVA